MSTSYSNQPIKYYGGTPAEINSLEIWDDVPDDVLGLTRIVTYTVSGTHTYGGVTKTMYTYSSVNGYIVERNYMNYYTYLNTCTHELGHAMGWSGHSSNPSWIMTQGLSEEISLYDGEINHLAQIY